MSDHLVEGVMVPAGGGCYAHRIVLRDLGVEHYERFVVHEQVLPTDVRPFYNHGDYFRDLERALVRFRERNGVNERRVAAPRLRAVDNP